MLSPFGLYGKNPLKSFCVNNKCEENPGHGQECIALENAQTCAKNLYCKKNDVQSTGVGSEIVNAVQPKGTCYWLDNVRKFDQSCDKDSNCISNLRCKNSKCSLGAEGDTCSSNNDCANNLCYQGKCIVKKGLNETCNNDDFYCKSNICVENKCRQTRKFNETCGNSKCGYNCWHHCKPLVCNMTSESKGICVKKSEGSSCTSGPIECISGMCVDRKCSKLRQEGQTCGETSCAGMNEDNNCDYQCEGDLICLNYKCSEKRDVGESCDNDGHCIDGNCEKNKTENGILSDNFKKIINTIEDNFKGICIAEPNSRELDESCISNQDCKNEMICSNKLCKNIKELGDSCNSDQECKTRNCSGGVCKNKKFSVINCNDCTDNSECKSGYCKGEKCLLNRGNTDKNDLPVGEGKCNKNGENKDWPSCVYCKYGTEKPTFSSDNWCCREDQDCEKVGEPEGNQDCVVEEPQPIKVNASPFSLGRDATCSNNRQCQSGYCNSSNNKCQLNPGSDHNPAGGGKCGKTGQPLCSECAFKRNTVGWWTKQTWCCNDHKKLHRIKK